MALCPNITSFEVQRGSRNDTVFEAVIYALTLNETLIENTIVELKDVTRNFNPDPYL